MRKNLLVLILIMVVVIACSTIYFFYSTPTNHDTVENISEPVVIHQISIDNSPNVNIDIHMDAFRLDVTTVRNNRKTLSDSLNDGSLLIMYSDNIYNEYKYTYTPNRNFYYYTGIDRENFIVVVVKTDGRVAEHLFALDLDDNDQWLGDMITMEEAQLYSGITNVHELSKFESFVNQYIKNEEISHLYMDLGPMTYSELTEKAQDYKVNLTLSERYTLKLKDDYPDLNIVTFVNHATQQRSLKQETEIEKIQSAIDITHLGILNILSNVTPQMTENQLEAYFDFALETVGVKEHAFPTIMAGGENANILHYSANDQVIHDGDLVLMDLGASFGYYSADISRTIPVNGKFSDRQKKLYNIVLKAQIAAIEAVKPGSSIGKINQVAIDILAEELKNIGLITSNKEVYRYMPHGVSHSLGLDTHDPINYSDTLKPGNVITVEPGLYIPEEGIGIRIEDNILVTENGYINLSEKIIKTVEDIESFMNNNQ